MRCTFSFGIVSLVIKHCSRSSNLLTSLKFIAFVIGYHSSVPLDSCIYWKMNMCF